MTRRILGGCLEAGSPDPARQIERVRGGVLLGALLGMILVAASNLRVMVVSPAAVLGRIETAAGARTYESYEALLAYYGTTGGWASLVAAVVIIAASASVSDRRAFADRNTPTES